MKSLFYCAIILSITFGFYGCKTNDAPSPEQVTKIDLQEQETLDAIIKSKDEPSKTEIQEKKENLQQIEKKYGEQWSFCACVIANDSLTKAIKKLNDDEFESTKAVKLLERSDYVLTKCQAFLGMDPNKTPEEREKHKKKVNNCLKEAGLK